MLGKGLRQTRGSRAPQVRQLLLRNPALVTKGGWLKACRHQTWPRGRSAFLPGPRVDLDVRVKIRGGHRSPKPPSSVRAWPSWQVEVWEHVWRWGARKKVRFTHSTTVASMSPSARARGTVSDGPRVLERRLENCNSGREARRGGWPAVLGV